MKEGVQGIIVDWAGTVVDFGCIAPAKAFIRVFRKHGIELTLEEVRGPMGLAKRDHVKAILDYPGVAARWQSIFRQPSTEADIDILYKELEPAMAEMAAEFATPIKGSLEFIEEMHKLGIKIGSTTGYTGPIMKNLIPAAAQLGLIPDCVVTSSDVEGGRPKPWMCYLNAQRMNIYPMQSMIKIGDTLADLEEGLNAGMWTISLTLSGNEIGLSQEEIESASLEEIRKKENEAKSRFMNAGAHYTAEGIWDCIPIVDLINEKLKYGKGPDSGYESFLIEGDLNSSAERTKWKARNLDLNTREWLQKDSDCFVHQSLSTPCLNVLEECNGIYLTDLQGKKYMDFHGNNVHQLGFRNPYVVKRIQDQLEKLPFSTRRYTNIPAIELAYRLTDGSKGNFKKVLFAPGGAEANAMAIRLSRMLTGKHKIISMWDSFHGATLDTISIGGESQFKKNSGPLLPDVINIPPYISYRGIWCNPYSADNGERIIEYLEYVLEKDKNVGALIAEAIRNTTVHIPRSNFWPRIKEICKKNGVLLIFDEIATSLYRTGKMFAYENFSVEPDMVTIGKGLGAGIIPMAALLVKEMTDSFENDSIGHFTFEKNPLGATAALASIEFAEKENLADHVVQCEKIIHKRLKTLKKECSLVGDVRGIGMLWAVELVKDKVTKEPAIAESDRIMYRCLEKGLNFKVSSGNILTLSPPLIIKKKELHRAIDILEDSIQAEIISHGKN